MTVLTLDEAERVKRRVEYCGGGRTRKVLVGSGEECSARWCWKVEVRDNDHYKQIPIKDDHLIFYFLLSVLYGGEGQCQTQTIHHVG